MKTDHSEYEPLVSIALTTSKSERFLKEQVDSLLNQTYKNLEVVASHDECGDGTVALLEAYAKQDPRFRWEYNKLAKGFIKNNENAISLCKGDIIFLCDHDDSWDLDRVRQHVEAYQDPSVMWVYNRIAVTDGTNTNIIGYLEDRIPDYFTKERQRLLYYTWGSCIGGAMTSYRASILKRVMPIPDFVPGHDSWIQLAIFPEKSFFIDKVLQTYRQHGANEVGWNETPSEEKSRELEKKAIVDNFRYLSLLPHCRQLSLWKRTFFLFVYWAKLIRKFFRGR